MPPAAVPMPGPASHNPESADARRPAGDYDRFCRDLRDACGIDLAQYRRGPTERGVRSLAARRGRPHDLAAYARLLAGDRPAREELVGHLTVNASRLWRNPGQWRLLERRVLPGLAASGAGRLRCWSAGCSYGAEAYTLAAVAVDAVPRAQVTILGTDIDRRVIERARTAGFGADDVGGAPPAALAAHFTRHDGRWYAGAALRRLVRFEQADLLRLPARTDGFDLVLCRNTMLYFADDARDALLRRLARSIRPGGVLMIGNTERLADPCALGLERVAPSTFRRRCR